jgi:mannose-1-phosphate guanylyltransferase
MTVLKAFLLVAGRGERLRPLTDTVPKCLLPINGTPLLQIWLEHLQKTGVNEVLINTHWLHDQVHDFVNHWSASQRKINIILFHEPDLLGSAGTILANRQWAGHGPFFVIYGDILTHFDLQKMLKRLTPDMPVLSVLMKMILSLILRKNRKSLNLIWEPGVSILPITEFSIFSLTLIQGKYIQPST